MTHFADAAILKSDGDMHPIVGRKFAAIVEQIAQSRAQSGLLPTMHSFFLLAYFETPNTMGIIPVEFEEGISGLEHNLVEAHIGKGDGSRFRMNFCQLQQFSAVSVISCTSSKTRALPGIRLWIGPFVEPLAIEHPWLPMDFLTHATHWK